MLSFLSTNQLIFNFWGPLCRKVRESVDLVAVFVSEFQGEFIFQVLGAKRTTYFICSTALLGQSLHSAWDAGVGAGPSLLALVGDPVFLAGALGSFDNCYGKLTGYLAWVETGGTTC